MFLNRIQDKGSVLYIRSLLKHTLCTEIELISDNLRLLKILFTTFDTVNTHTSATAYTFTYRKLFGIIKSLMGLMKFLVLFVTIITKM
jgi:hypothetical protein